MQSGSGLKERRRLWGGRRIEVQKRTRDRTILTLTRLVAAIGLRTLTDMVIFSPFATCYFYLCGGLLEGRPWSVTPEMSRLGEQGIKERIEERLWGTVKLQWAVFGPSSIFMHAVVPVYARPPFMNAISYVLSFNSAGKEN